MMRLLRQIPQATFTPRTYVVAATDAGSESKALALERELAGNPSAAHDQHNGQDPTFAIVKIPRSREVKQSWVSTLFTTLYAATVSLGVLLKIQPDMLVCNGPGTCVPIALLARLLRFLGVLDTRVVFVESLARVHKLSLSGRILYPFADQLIVQWPELAAKYPKAVYQGRLV
ncbi:oligosaccharide biosynthesis protein Alg14-like protein [Entophlyctis helioformis]|nr:oligosaccharide biosynthesis protein Alg14-like protein [Entophlyctis helioformis]